MSDPNTIREEKPILSLSVYLDRVDYTIDSQNLIALCRACGNDTVLNGYIAYLKSRSGRIRLRGGRGRRRG